MKTEKKTGGQSGYWKKGGRPKKKQEELRSQIQVVRFTPQEMASIQKRFRQSGCRNMGEFWHKIMSSGCVRVYERREWSKESESVVRQLGNDINRIAMYINNSGIKTESEQAIEVLKEVAKMLENMLQYRAMSIGRAPLIERDGESPAGV